MRDTSMPAASCIGHRMAECTSSWYGCKPVHGVSQSRLPRLLTDHANLTTTMRWHGAHFSGKPACPYERRAIWRVLPSYTRQQCASQGALAAKAWAREVEDHPIHLREGTLHHVAAAGHLPRFLVKVHLVLCQVRWRRLLDELDADRVDSVTLVGRGVLLPQEHVA